MNTKVFNLIARVNETTFLVQCQSSESQCRLNESVCNSKQNQNYDERRCECKELGDWGSCKNYYMWNLSKCNWDHHKVCKSGEYLCIKNCLCKKRLIGIGM